MKTKLTLITLLILVGCITPNGGTQTYKIQDYVVKTIDSCEYLEYSYCFGSNVGVYSLTHKGNCKLCIERNKSK